MAKSRHMAICAGIIDMNTYWRAISMGKPERVFVAYALMIVITFGHAFNRDYDERRERLGGENGFVAIFKAFGWPLYWSMVAFEGLKPR